MVKRAIILVADDHPVVRDGLIAILSTQADLEVVGEAGNGQEVLAQVAELEPHIVLLDLEMPELDGVETLETLQQTDSKVRAIVFTAFDTDERILGAVQAGAQGYLLKDIQPNELVKAVRETFQGKTQLHPDIAHRLMTAVSGSAPPQDEKQASPLEELQILTEREREVLDWIAHGLSNREIAEKMVISEKTVKTHVSNLLDKLDLEDRTRAAIWALKHGLGSED